MSNKNQNNKSVYIMFTDMVGYSILVSKNQPHALKLLEEHDQIISKQIQNYNGRIIKHTGDGYFASFKSADDALSSALNFQTKIKNRNQIVNEKNKFQVRVGIHSGEAIEKNNDLFGHDINIASRIESICVIGGIAISDDILLSLNNKNIFSRKMGYVKMKNIRKPKLLHNIYLSKKDCEAQTDNELTHSQLKRGINIVDINEYQIQNTFSVGICYFKSVDSDVESQEKITRNLTEDIISDFEKINDVRTASKVDVKRFSNSNYSVHEMANKLQVNNILKGAISFKNNSMNLTIKMFNTFKGDYVFNESYECGHDNANFLRTKVLTRIMKEFDLEAPLHIIESLSRKMSENSIALEKYNQGKYYIQRLISREDIEKAHKLFKEACDLDHHFIEALAEYGLTLQKLGEYDEAEEYLEKALKQAENEKYDVGIAYIYNYMGILYYNWGKTKLSLNCYEKSLKLQNKLNDKFQESKILGNVSEHYILEGNTDKALACLERSRDIKIDLEETQALAYTFAQFGNLYSFLEDFSKSCENIEKTVAIAEEKNMLQLKSQNLVTLAQCYANLGLFDNGLLYINKALPMLKEFDNVMAIGRSYLYRGKIMFNKGDYKTAIEDLKDSIEQFQMCEQKWLVLIANIELAIVYICDDNHNNAEKCLNKALKIGKRIKGFEPFVLLGKMVHASFNADQDPDSLYEKVKSYKNNSTTYKHWYFLSVSYRNLGKKKQADECLFISQELLKKSALKNSNKDHQQSMLKNIPLHQKILNP